MSRASGGARRRARVPPFRAFPRCDRITLRPPVASAHARKHRHDVGSAPALRAGDNGGWFTPSPSPSVLQSHAAHRADDCVVAAAGARARHPPRDVRLSGVPRRAGRDRRSRRGRRRRARADAHRRRQVAVLPDPVAAARRHRRRRVAADRADAGPGGRAEAGGRARGVPQFVAGRGRGARGRARARGRRARPPLRRAGAADDGALPRPPLPRAHRALRDRRGALRVAVGTRLSSGVPRAVGAARALPRRSARRAHRHRRSADARGDHRAPGTRSRADLRVELRPPQHPLHDRRQGRAARAAAALHPRRARGRRGDRLLPVAAQGRRDRGVAADAGRQRAAVPRGHGQRGAQRAPEPLPARGRHRRRRDDRVRHGHRQARRAVRRAPRPAEERGGLLPGDGPRRARRRARGRVDDVRSRRRRAAAAADRVLRGERRVQARVHRQARCAARPVRDRGLPARAAARVLRRGERALRQLRHLPQRRRRRGTRPTPRARRCR